MEQEKEVGRDPDSSSLVPSSPPQELTISHRYIVCIDNEHMKNKGLNENDQ